MKMKKDERITATNKTLSVGFISIPVTVKRNYAIMMPIVVIIEYTYDKSLTYKKKSYCIFLAM